MLNAEQRQAVQSQAQATLVVAGPGSGKTRVIIHRLIYLLQQGVNPENILALTFSRPAALEMKARVAEAIPEALSSLWVDTFHAFSAEILRQGGELIGVNPFFEIATNEDSLAILAGLLSDERFAHLNVDLEAVLKFISRAKDEAVLADEYAAYVRTIGNATAKPNQLSPQDLAYLYAAYQKELANQGLLDFGDLILKALELLKTNQKARQQWQQFAHILVDEFQDTNYAQGELLKLLKSKNTAIFVVGDDDQSIYRFRGASLKNILDFQQTFNPTYKVNLRQNYRSGRCIVQASQGLIQNNTERLEKQLEPAFNFPDAVTVVETDTPEAQADFVAKQILNLKEAHHLLYKDFALLFTSVRLEAGPFMETFQQENIPFTVSNFDNLAASPVIRELISWLKLIADPFSWSSLASILITAYGLEAQEVAQLQHQRLYKETAIELVKKVNAGQKDKRLTDFLKTYKGLVKLSYQLSLDKFIAKLIKQFNLLNKSLLYSPEEFRQRQTELKYFLTLANRYCRYQPDSSLGDFLNYLKRVPQITVTENEPAEEDKVNLMTLHAAKGLEFKVVFIVNLTKNKMPGRRRPAVYDLPDALLKEKFAQLDATEQHKNERRRLLYVGMTRAKEQLFLLYPQEENKPNQRSPFLDEILSLTAVNQIKYAAPAKAEGFHLVPLWPRLASVYDADLIKESLVKNIAKLFNVYETYLYLSGQERQEVKELLETVSKDLFKAKWQLKLTELKQADLMLLEKFFPQRAVEAEKQVTASKSVNLTVSDLSLYLKCPNQFKFKVVYKIPSLPNRATQFGVLIHRVLQKFHQHSLTEPTSLDLLLNLYDQALASLPALYYPPETEINDYRQALKDYFVSFVNQEADCYLIERPFDLALNGHLISGRVDRVDKLKSGGFELIDYKTGNPKTKSDIKKEIQLAVYALGALKSWQLKPEKLTYYFIKSGEKVSLHIEEVDLKMTEALLEETLDNITAGRFSPSENFFHCKYCEYELICQLKQRRLK